MRRLLYPVIRDIVSGRSLTYREIVSVINRDYLYPEPGGLLVAEAQVRSCVSAHPDLFRIDRSATPNRVSLVEADGMGDNQTQPTGNSRIHEPDRSQPVW